MGKVPPLSPELLAKSRRAQTEAAAKVKGLLKQSNFDADDEKYRAEAAIRAENGDFTSLAYLTIGPTKEQMEKFDYMPVEAKLDNANSARLKTVRRDTLPRVAKMMRRGLITSEQYIAANWYADRSEEAGHLGNIKSRRYERDVIRSSVNHARFTDQQSEAQSDIRFVKDRMDKAYIKFFEAIVIEHIPLRRAARFARCRNDRALPMLQKILDQVADAREELKKCT